MNRFPVCLWWFGLGWVYAHRDLRGYQTNAVNGTLFAVDSSGSLSNLYLALIVSLGFVVLLVVFCGVYWWNKRSKSTDSEQIRKDARNHQVASINNSVGFVARKTQLETLMKNNPFYQNPMYTTGMHDEQSQMEKTNSVNVELAATKQDSISADSSLSSVPSHRYKISVSGNFAPHKLEQTTPSVFYDDIDLSAKDVVVSIRDRIQMPPELPPRKRSAITSPSVDIKSPSADVKSSV